MLSVQEIHQEQNGTNISTNAWEETKRRRPWSPLESGDNLELNTTDIFPLETRRMVSKSRYQSMIGAAQWVINLGRFDIAVHVI